MTAKLVAPAASRNWGKGFSMAGEHKVVWGILNPDDIQKNLSKKYERPFLKKLKDEKEREEKRGKNPWKYKYLGRKDVLDEEGNFSHYVYSNSKLKGIETWSIGQEAC